VGEYVASGTRRKRLVALAAGAPAATPADPRLLAVAASVVSIRS
jgi:hypothetical protein